MPNKKNDKPVVLVTGSTGLIGTKLQRALAHDYRVVGLDVRKPDEASPGAEFIQCDLTDDASVTRALAAVRDRFGSRVASVVHLAAYYDFSGEPSPLYEQLTVGGTRRLVRSLTDFDVEQFVFSSSLLAMEPLDDAETGEKLTESSPLKGEWDYPRSKIEAEKVLLAEHGTMPVVVLRIAGIYDEDCSSIPIAHQIARIYEMKLESYLFPGDTSHGQAFVHIDDAVRAIERSISRRGDLEGYEVFLIAEPEVLSYADLQDRIGGELHGTRWPTVRIPKPVAKLGAWAKEKLSGEDPFIKPWMVDLADDHYEVEIRRARDRLGWEPAHLLRRVLGEMLRRLSVHPERWYEHNGLALPGELEKRRQRGA